MLRAFRHIKSEYAKEHSFNSFHSELVFDLLHEANIDTAGFEFVVPLNILKKIVLKLRNSDVAVKYGHEITQIEADIRWAIDKKVPDVTYHMFK